MFTFVTKNNLKTILTLLISYDTIKKKLFYNLCKFIKIILSKILLLI